MKITIVRSHGPLKGAINEEIKWFGQSLGLFGLRDRNSSCYRIFVELLKSSKGSDGVTSDELSYRTGLSRGTVVHHINHMIELGIVNAARRRYLLRVANLEALVNELRRDMLRSLEDLKEVAKRIDEELGL